MSDTQADPVLAALVRWAEKRPDVSAAWVTSTRAKTGAADPLSDYDVVLVVEHIHPYAADRAWLSAFGEVLVVYQDPLQEPYGTGFETFGIVTQYVDGLHIDFTLWPTALLRHVVDAGLLPGDLDDGYRVLFDRDSLAARLPPPTYHVYVPQRPSAGAFAKWVEEFYSDVPFVAKQLWRCELLPARWCLDADMKHVYLRQMLEWHAASESGWARPVGWLGKGLKKRLAPELWAALEETYVDARVSSNWQALFDTLDLFRAAGLQVAERLGYPYPLSLHERLTALAREIQALDGAAHD